MPFNRPLAELAIHRVQGRAAWQFSARCVTRRLRSRRRCDGLACGTLWRREGLAMSKKLVLVDYENVQRIDLSMLDDSYRAIVFVGANQ